VVFKVNSANIHIGRLLEIRIDTAYRTAADVDAMFARILAECKKCADDVRFAVVVDWRRCPIMSSEASERHLYWLTRRNPRVERSATLALQDAPSAMLQFLRLVRESQNENRRVFDQAPKLIDWLSEVLTPAEQQRLADFIAECAG
jgi:hypothetical protein